MFLARKITRCKWDHKEGQLAEGEIAADAVTADLRTRNNELSFWQCGEAEGDDLRKVALAIASGQTKIVKIDLVWLCCNDLQADRQYMRKTKGDTPVQSLKQLHMDLCRIDHVRLGRIALRVSEAIKNNHYYRVNRSCVIDILVEAVSKGLLGVDDLKNNVREEIKTKIERTR